MTKKSKNISTASVQLQKDDKYDQNIEIHYIYKTKYLGIWWMSLESCWEANGPLYSTPTKPVYVYGRTFCQNELNPPKELYDYLDLV